ISDNAPGHGGAQEVVEAQSAAPTATALTIRFTGYAYHVALLFFHRTRLEYFDILFRNVVSVPNMAVCEKMEAPAFMKTVCALSLVGLLLNASQGQARVV